MNRPGPRIVRTSSCVADRIWCPPPDAAASRTNMRSVCSAQSRSPEENSARGRQGGERTPHRVAPGDRGVGLARVDKHPPIRPRA
eukprot:345926-Chlamydomonas_euryale.AAC.1